LDILIADAGFNMLGGAERAARDLAVSLVERGHRVAAFSVPIGPHRRSVEDLGFPAVWSLADLPFRPDVIHAQHHLDAMTAIVGLGDVPVVYHCHGATFYDAVPRHPRIHHYVAVSSTLAQRIVVESGIAERDITVIPNAVDLRRFATVREPVPSPMRAAVFGNQIARRPLADTIASALRARGLRVDFIGRSFGNEISCPETALLDYDIVFASGKSAIDAIACGCAVVITGLQGCGEMVEPDNFDRLRSVNFTIPVNTGAPDEPGIAAALSRYRPEAARDVTRRLRSEAGLEGLVDAFERLYEDAVGAYRSAANDGFAERTATAAYLRRLAPVARTLDEGGEQTVEALALRTRRGLSMCANPS
jgi:glycosyltransferase involved in cell wall biosynthesis